MSKKKKVLIGVFITVLVLAGILFCLFLTGSIAHAAGLVDEAVNAENLYSKYGLKNYQLDFYVDTSGGWLPWNWGDSIGKNVMYGLYIITNGLWMVSVNISSITGSVIAEAYQLDFVGSVSETLGTNLQTIAGVSTAGFSSDGLYVKLLPWFIALTGISVAWHGLIKHETSKALNVFLSFVLTFVFSAAFIAYSPDYMSSINEFSSDLSTAMLDVGTKVLIPDNDVEGESSVDIIRDNLFAIQVYKPWLLLQYGTMDVDTIGQERIDKVLAVSPSDGETREEKVIEEVKDNANMNMSVTEVPSRFGSVLLMLIINVVISIFAMLLTGVMLLSQLLFIMFSLVLPISFLKSMIPGQGGKWAQAVEKIFNTIVTRAGISFIMTIAFCISSMVYGLTEGKPFLLIGVLQILVFVGVFCEMRELLGVMSIQGNNAGNIARRMFYRPFMSGKRFVRRQLRKNRRHTPTNVTSGKEKNEGSIGNTNELKTKQNTQNRNEMAEKQELKRNKAGVGERAGNVLGKGAGAISDVPAKVADTVKKPFEKVRDLPTNAKYAAYSISKGFKDEREQSKQKRQDRQERRGNTKEYKRMQMSGDSGTNIPVNSEKIDGKEVKKDTRKQGEFAYKKDKGTSEQKKYDIGKLPKGASLNTSRQEKQEGVEQNRIATKVVTKAPTLKEGGIKRKPRVTVPEDEKNREIKGGRKEFQFRTRRNDVGKLPEGATLNYQKADKKSKKMNKER